MNCLRSSCDKKTTAFISTINLGDKEYLNFFINGTRLQSYKTVICLISSCLIIQWCEGGSATNKHQNSFTTTD